MDEEKGFSRNANRALSIGVSVLLTLALMTAIALAVIRLGFSGSSKPVGTYDFGGWEMDVYADPMPLYVQDLFETNCESWSTHAKKDETFLVSRTEYRQRPLTDDRTVPDLEYTVVEVHADFLYHFCKNSLIRAREDVVIDGETVFADHYEPVDAAPWGVSEVYRNYVGDGYTNRYLLCREREQQIVEIRFDRDPAPEQMAAAVKHLFRG